MLGSVIRVNKKYYLKTLLKDCKYETKKNKIENLINDDFYSSSLDESGNDSDSEPDSNPGNESDNNESNDSFANESKN